VSMMASFVGHSSIQTYTRLMHCCRQARGRVLSTSLGKSKKGTV